jgi:hypothetical protein
MVMRRPVTPRARPGALVSLRQALASDQLLGGILSGDSWRAWRTLLIAAMGESLTADERLLFHELTGRDHEPNQRVEEFVGVIGRRGGKSRAISVLATYIAALCEHPMLAPGERGLVLCIAPDVDQASVILDYITANFEQSPMLRDQIHKRVKWALKLRDGIDIEVRASDFRRLRGVTCVACVADESAFWRSENSTNPDCEILAAVRPTLATTRGPLFLISSPYARRGELWSLYSRHYGPTGDPLILVAKADSRTMNPSLPQSVVDRAMERDPASAAAEYLATFRTDIESFVNLEAVAACVTKDVREREPQAGIKYYAAIDPSGGSSDSMTLCISHRDRASGVIVIDCIRERTPPFSPEAVCREFAATLKSYNVSKVASDRYGGAWPTEQFYKCGIACEPFELPKSDLYLALLPLINSTKIELLDHSKMLNQLTGLERRTARSGKDSIDHAPGGHDDLINAVAGAAYLASAKKHWDRASLHKVLEFARVPGRYPSDVGYGAALRPRTLMDSGRAPTPHQPMPVMPRQPDPGPLFAPPSFSVASKLPEGTSSKTTPFTELVNRINK